MEPEDVITFHETNLPQASFTAFEEMKKSGDLCDITLSIGSRSLVAHRVVLAATIPYFRSAFKNCGMGTKTKDIVLDHLDYKTLELLIDFAYTCKIKISIENVQSLVLASEFFGLSRVTDACADFLSKRMTAESVVEIHTLADNLNISKLKEISNHFICQNFENISTSERFLNLPFSCIKEVISADDLNVSGEETVFEAVVKWVKTSPSQRHGVMADLLAEVRMVHLSYYYLIKRIASEELVKASKPCNDLIDDVKNYHLLPKDRSLFSNLRVKPRKSYSNNENDLLYAVCQCSTSGTSVCCYDSCKKTWDVVARRTLNDTIYHSVAVEEKIFMFFARTIHTLHIKTLKWEVLEAKHERLYNAAVVHYNNLIYCFGSSYDDFVDKVRCFDTQKNLWLKDGKMTAGRGNSAAAPLGESIYLTGGVIHDDIYLSVVEKYNPSDGQWSEALSMLNPRGYHQCISMKDKIFVCGGYTTNGGTSSSAETYDPITDQWTAISSLAIARDSFSLVSYKGKICALGGRLASPKSFFDRLILHFEMYDPETNQWISGFSLPDKFRHAVSMRNASAKNERDFFNESACFSHC